MNYREYCYLKKLYELSPKMQDDQKYSMHFVSDVEKATEYTKDDVLTLALDLAKKDYVKLGQNKEDAKERSGYIHTICITYRGVFAMKKYKSDKVWSMIRNIIIPAVVSIIVSVVVSLLCGK